MRQHKTIIDKIFNFKTPPPTFLFFLLMNTHFYDFLVMIRNYYKIASKMGSTKKFTTFQNIFFSFFSFPHSLTKRRLVLKTN